MRHCHFLNLTCDIGDPPSRHPHRIQGHMYVIECIIILSHVLRGQSIMRDRSSIMGRGAMQREGEASEVSHLGKGGGGEKP